jgi:hypothetical protein
MMVNTWLLLETGRNFIRPINFQQANVHDPA